MRGVAIRARRSGDTQTAPDTLSPATEPRSALIRSRRTRRTAATASLNPVPIAPA